MKRLCSVFLLIGALAFSACTGIGSSQQKNGAADALSSAAQAEKAAPETAEQTAESEEAEIPPPSPEQQAAAIEQLKTSELVGRDVPPAGGLSPISSPEAAPSPLASSAQDIVPGGKKLRMGAFATPEESISSEGISAPAPNSVELKGFRSPKMPVGLPMDINGKITDAASE